MKTIKLKSWEGRPQGFTGIAKWPYVKAWFQNGKFHRVNGPAIEWDTGNKEWHILGEKLLERQFKIFQNLWKSTSLEKTEETMKAYAKLCQI